MAEEDPLFYRLSPFDFHRIDVPLACAELARKDDFGVLKTLVKIDADAILDDTVGTGEKSVFDLRPHLTANNGWITDKPEGAAVTTEGASTS
jgi:hypothetical protein